MANDQGTGLGLFPVEQPYGNIRTHYYRVKTDQALFRFQPVQLDGAGLIIPAIIGDNRMVLGSIVGFVNNPSKGGLPTEMTALSHAAYFRANEGEAWAAVSDDPNQIYLIESDTGGGTYPAATDVGSTAAFTYEATTGSTTTGICTARLDSSDIAADSGGSLQIVAAGENVNSDGTPNTLGATTAYSKLLVRISRHQLGPIGLTALT